MASGIKVLVTGGGGYVGAVLVPKLLAKGYRVKVLDLYIYGEHVLDAVKDNSNMEQIKGDIRDRALLEQVIPGYDAVIPLDEVIAAMDEVGRSLPAELRCTALGGLSVTPTSRAIEARLERESEGR